MRVRIDQDQRVEFLVQMRRRSSSDIATRPQRSEAIRAERPSMRVRLYLRIPPGLRSGDTPGMRALIERNSFRSTAIYSAPFDAKYSAMSVRFRQAQRPRRVAARISHIDSVAPAQPTV